MMVSAYGERSVRGQRMIKTPEDSLAQRKVNNSGRKACLVFSWIQREFNENSRITPCDEPFGMNKAGTGNCSNRLNYKEIMRLCNAW